MDEHEGVTFEMPDVPARPYDGREDPLNPAARLRPDHLGGVPIRLRDGDEWLFPEPVIEFVEDGGRPDGIRTVSDISPAFDAALNDLEDAQEGLLDDAPAGEDDRARTRRIIAQNRRLRGQSLRLAGEMLRRNYRLSVEETGRLIRWKSAGEDELYREILAVAQGVSDRPKQCGPGSPSASGPTG